MINLEPTPTYWARKKPSASCPSLETQATLDAIYDAQPVDVTLDPVSEQDLVDLLLPLFNAANEERKSDF